MAIFKQITGKIKYRENGMNAPIQEIKLQNWCIVSMLHKIHENLIVNGFPEGKPAAFTVHMGSCTIQTMTRSPVKVLGKVEIHFRWASLTLATESSLKTLSTKWYLAYGFIVDLRENFLRVDQEKMKSSIFNSSLIIISDNHLINHMRVAKEGDNRLSLIHI